MKVAGQLVLFRFPHTDLDEGKLRPALLIARLPGNYDDWLVCMVSSQTRHAIDGFDLVIQPTDADFEDTGLRTASVLRIGRLAVVDGERLLGAIGRISDTRLEQVRQRLAEWVSNGE